MSSAGLECYALRYEDLLTGFCSGNLQQCNWDQLRAHQETAGVAEGRIRTCRAWDTQCLLMRHPALRQSYCKSNVDMLDCDWRK